MSLVILDIREPVEYTHGHVKGAINVPPSSLLNGAPELKDVPKNSEIITYCITGSRSNVAIQFLHNLGFTNVTNGINQAQVEASYLN